MSNWAFLTIYRVQDHEGRGPFRPGFSKKWIDAVKPHEDKLVPWRLQFPDVVWKVQSQRGWHFGCGCESEEQLRMWFSEAELHRLAVFGYGPVRMRVDKILGRSDVQSVFARYKPLVAEVEHLTLYEVVPR